MKTQCFAAILAVIGLSDAQTVYRLRLLTDTPNAATDVFGGFMSFSIELSSFPDFAGNRSNPNTYSNNLLENLGNLQGRKPYIRVGGVTQDFSLYDISLPVAVIGTMDPSVSQIYPAKVQIGPSFFESYLTWNATKFSYGFNMAMKGPRADEALNGTVPLLCQVLETDRFYLWEYGNEPDLYSTSGRSVRPQTWNEPTYVTEWLGKTRQIKDLVERYCSKLVTTPGLYGYIGPSFAGVGNKLKAPNAFSSGLNADSTIRLFSSHNYMGGTNSPGVTLQGTLMNHTNTVKAIQAHVKDYNAVTAVNGTAPPHIFGQHNSLYHAGRPGLTNSFGAALWGIDFNLYAASVNIVRQHMHLGTDFPYSSWQPISTEKTTIGTKAPYYGNIAVAAMVKDSALSSVSIQSIPLPEDTESAYVSYAFGGVSISRIMVLNMREYNTTVDGAGLVPLPTEKLPLRGSRKYVFDVSAVNIEVGRTVNVRRLLANGSDAITGITWDGWSYAWELARGVPVRLSNVTVGETILVGPNGTVSVEVADSTAVMLDFGKPPE